MPDASLGTRTGDANGSVAVAIDRRGNLVGNAVVRAQGVPVEDERDPFLEEAADAAEAAVRKGGRDREKLREQLRLAVRRVATRWTGKKPIVDVLLIEA